VKLKIEAPSISYSVDQNYNSTFLQGQLQTCQFPVMGLVVAVKKVDKIIVILYLYGNRTCRPFCIYLIQKMPQVAVS
jgi:hypothetical protein